LFKPEADSSRSELMRTDETNPAGANNGNELRNLLSLWSLLFLAVNVVWAEPVKLPRQVVTLPPNSRAPLFVDIDGDGRSDLLVIDPVEKKLLNYHQRPAGFTNSADQVLPLPPQTAWVVLCNVDAYPGLELLFSTATGILYSRQNAGLFESERRTLIEANQVFTNNDFPILTSLTNENGTNLSIPVIYADRVVPYHRDNAYRWNPRPPVPLGVKNTAWHVNHDYYPWTMGPNPAHSLRIQQTLRAKLQQEPEKEPENGSIRKIIEEMKKNGGPGPPRTNHVDVDGDGREDLILWQINGKLDLKTDVNLFLRGPDQRLPERPTQILHCRGFPIPIGSTTELSPVSDLNGDGICELVLIELKTTVASPSGLLEMALSHGVDWSLTIRTFSHGAFSGSSTASVPVTAMLPLDDLNESPLCIQGDFNGDGRPDLLVRRSEIQWNIFPSTTDPALRNWFARQPALTFEAPAHGFLEIKDLNGDALSDIIWHEQDEPRLSIFFSPSPQGKAKNP
jgi:hypothetical protein